MGIDPLYLQQVKQEGHRFEIMSFLEQHARDGLIEFYRLRQGRKARFAQPALPLTAPIQQAIQSSLSGFQGFFQHQAHALDAIRQGRNLVAVLGASGTIPLPDAKRLAALDKEFDPETP